MAKTLISNKIPVTINGVRTWMIAELMDDHKHHCTAEDGSLHIFPFNPHGWDEGVEHGVAGNRYQFHGHTEVIKKKKNEKTHEEPQ